MALDRNTGPGYNTLLLRLIPGDLLSACLNRQFHTLPDLFDSRAAPSNPYPNALRAMPCQAVCTIFMMVFGMTRPGREPTTYHVKGGHANHLANPTRSGMVEVSHKLGRKHGRRNRGGGRGGAFAPPPPNILPTQKIQDCKNNDI